MPGQYIGKAWNQGHTEKSHTEHCTRGCWKVLSPTRKEKSYGNQPRDLFNIIPTKLNTLPSPLLYLLQATQKKIRMLSVQPGVLGSNDLRFERKMANFQLIFQSREEVVVRWGQIQRVGWVFKTLEIQEGQFLLSCKCSVGWGIVMQEQDPIGEIPLAFFLQNILQLHQQRWVTFRVDSLALWKIINEEDTVLIPTNRGEKFFSGFLHSEFFGAGRPAILPLHWLLLCSGS